MTRRIIASTSRNSTYRTVKISGTSSLSAPPARPAARSLLLDVAALKEDFIFVDPVSHAQSELDIPDACFELNIGTNRSEFNPADQINGCPLDGGIWFDHNIERYVIESTVLACVRRIGALNSGSDLVSYLNQSQSFSVIPQSPGAIYCDGTFFDPKLEFGAGFDPLRIGLAGLLESHPSLAGLRTEKGGRVSATPAGWAVGSVFQWIEANADQLVSNPQLVLCDDGTREACDFIIVGGTAAEPIVAMVHAKACHDRAHASASSLHEVCGQALKQVAMLNCFEPRKPPQFRTWRGPWEGPNEEGTVSSRIRLEIGAWVGLTGEQIWSRLEELLRRQTTRREVIMVLGATLESRYLFQTARRATVPPSTVHVVHLLRSVVASIAAAGASLKIHCD